MSEAAEKHYLVVGIKDTRRKKTMAGKNVKCIPQVGTGVTGESHPFLEKGCPTDSGGDNHPLEKQTVGNQANLVTGTNQEMLDPFKRKDSLPRSPPSRDRKFSLPDLRAVKKGCAKETESEISCLKKKEKLAFEALGKNVEIIDKIVKDSRNIHKQIRDAIAAATIYYQRMKDAREGMEKINEEIAQISSAKDARIQHEDTVHQVKTHNCETQTEFKTTKHMEVQTVDKDIGQKRVANSPLETPKKRVRTKTVPAHTAAARQTSLVLEAGATASPERKEGTSEWQTVDHRKGKKNKDERIRQTGEQSNEKINGGRKTFTKGQTKRRLPEAVAVKITSEISYANVLKDLRKKVDPNKMGIQVSGIRKTRAGEILIELKNDGKAEDLKTKVAEALGEDASVRTLDRTASLIIRDLDGVTEEIEIVEAIKGVAGNLGQDAIKVRALRKGFGETQVAIVTMPQKAAEAVLKEGRLRVGWVLCRVREKAAITRCFHCLGFGHIARDCKGPDRSKLSECSLWHFL